MKSSIDQALHSSSMLSHVNVSSSNELNSKYYIIDSFCMGATETVTMFADQREQMRLCAAKEIERDRRERSNGSKEQDNGRLQQNFVQASKKQM